MTKRHVCRLVGTVFLVFAHLSPFVRTVHANPHYPDLTSETELASIALTTDDMPPGFRLTGETFYPASAIANERVSEKQLIDGGFIAQYVSVYDNRDSNVTIRSTVTKWHDNDAARKGIARLHPTANGTATPAASPVADANVGEEPRRAYRVQIAGPNNEPVPGERYVFTRGRFTLSVTLLSPNKERLDLGRVIDLSRAMEGRAGNISRGEPVSGVNPALPQRVLPLGSMGTLTQAGFLSPKDIGHTFQEDSASLGSSESAWMNEVALGDRSLNRHVMIGITAFPTESDALTFLRSVHTVFPELQKTHRVDGFSIKATAGAIAFTFPSDPDKPDLYNGYAILYVIGSEVTVILLENDAGPIAAEKNATTLVHAQIACQTKAECKLPKLL